jgi:TolA-binding protein
MIQVENDPEDLLNRMASDMAVRSVLEPSLEDKMRNERAVSRAMSALTGGARRRTPRSVWLLAAAAVLVAGVAGARFWGRYRPQPTVPIGDTSAPTGAAKHAVEEPTNPPGTGPEVPTDAVGLSPPPDKAKSRTLPSPEMRETAAQVFADANELRRTGKDSQAMVTYRKVERLFPGSPEAEQSYATLGSLMMEHGSPQEALGQFDHYLERGGPLLVDVLAGKAGALQRLGRAGEERRTWETLLERFPKSVHATRAKTRLAELH